MHNKSLHGGRCSTKPCSCYKCWLDVYAHYAGLTKFGVVILAGTLDLFQRWAKSEACREEVKLVAQGRLFAFVNGYLLALDMHTGHASASVRDCTKGGVVVWGEGDYYEGGLKGGKKHGQGTFKWADGNTYTGGYVDDNQHGHGTFKWAGGTTYTGAFAADNFHGQGKKTMANGTVQKGRFENDKFMG
jgi:hypothetical protein